MEHAQHRARLKRLGLDDVLPYSFQTDTAPVIPVMEKGRLINVLK
jgi:phosphosulfolactate phosphohydrolase-like enzyme